MRTTIRLLILLTLTILLTSCHTIRKVETIPTERIHAVTNRDTIYLHDVSYDSIYVSQDKFIDRTRDTVTITNTKTEFRYKLKRGTILQTQFFERHDSIPYEVIVTQTKEVRAPPQWYDKLAYIISIAVLVIAIVKIGIRIRSPNLTLIRKLLPL